MFVILHSFCVLASLVSCRRLVEARTSTSLPPTNRYPLTSEGTPPPPTGALVSSSGRYRIELCDGWTGCSKTGDASEYIGFNNRTCTAGTPPASKTYEVEDTVGPLLRSSGVSKNWRTWTVDVVEEMTDRTIVTIENDFSRAKCTKRYIDDYSEKKVACKGTVWAVRVDRESMIDRLLMG